MTTLAPPAARLYAGMAPPKPVPMTSTSVRSMLMRDSCRVARARGQRVQGGQLLAVAEVREPPDAVRVGGRESEPGQPRVTGPDGRRGVEVPGGVERQHRHRRDRVPEQLDHAA